MSLPRRRGKVRMGMIFSNPAFTAKSTPHIIREGIQQVFREPLHVSLLYDCLLPGNADRIKENAGGKYG